MSEEDVKELLGKYKIMGIVIDGQTICIKNDDYEIIKDIKTKEREVVS